MTNYDMDEIERKRDKGKRDSANLIKGVFMRKKIGISLLFDEDTGEGSMTIRPTFADNNVLLQIDCLQDWIGELTTLYNKGLAEFRNNGSYSRNLLEVEEAHE